MSGAPRVGLVVSVDRRAGGAGPLRLVAACIAALLLVTFPSSAGASPTAGPTPTPPVVTPTVKPLVMAHYYIWFTPTSWNRAKKDTPLAGRYSSDDTDVMRQHVIEAKAAGIDGFIVSWKSTPPLNARLQALTAVARDLNFKLAITYQSLDFTRKLLPAARIGNDLDYFSDHFASNPVFDIFGKAMVVITGTPLMSRSLLHSVTAPRRARMLMLASDKQVEHYERIAPEVDGNLYYWSSVNPNTFGHYADKLRQLGDAVRAHGGIWVAPVAPGFDARLVGGTRAVDRADGQTLRTEWAAAVASDPAVIGIISWNEFSENTHIEPSRVYGRRALDVLAQLDGATPQPSTGDSSEPAGQGSPVRAILALGGVLALILFSVVVLARRHVVAKRPRRRLL